MTVKEDKQDIFLLNHFPLTHGRIGEHQLFEQALDERKYDFMPVQKDWEVNRVELEIHSSILFSNATGNITHEQLGINIDDIRFSTKRITKTHIRLLLHYVTADNQLEVIDFENLQIKYPVLITDAVTLLPQKTFFYVPKWIMSATTDFNVSVTANLNNAADGYSYTIYNDSLFTEKTLTSSNTQSLNITQNGLYLKDL